MYCVAHNKSNIPKSNIWTMMKGHTCCRVDPVRAVVILTQKYVFDWKKMLGLETKHLFKLKCV